METSLTSKRIKQTDWGLDFQEKPDETLNRPALQLISLLTLIFISYFSEMSPFILCYT